VIDKVQIGEDGRVRTVEVKYRNAGEGVFRYTTRNVHKVVTLVPADYEQPDEEDDQQEAAQDDEDIE
ncbi:MAG: hypothetical protein AN484_27870, partial [Aphanizomenon flos-aquae WA102]